MKTVFFGTPALAVSYLERLAALTTVRAVITAPDQPAGRGYAIKAPAVKSAAEKLGLRVMQPSSLKDDGFLRTFQDLSVDVAIVVAYGKLIPPPILAASTFGFLNVHFSLLPKYRGAAPMQWALVNGETETGVTLFWLDAGMDTGPLFLQKRTPIAAQDDETTLREKLIGEGVSLMEEGLAKLARGEKSSTPQSGEASVAPLIKKEDGFVDWNQSAVSIVNKLRGFCNWPGVYTTVQGHRLKLKKVRAMSEPRQEAPGVMIRVESGIGPVIECREGQIVLETVQPESKAPMSGADFLNGARLKVGEKWQ